MLLIMIVVESVRTVDIYLVICDAKIIVKKLSMLRRDVDVDGVKKH